MRRNPLDDIDPAVASIIEDAQRKQRIRKLPSDKREKARRDAARERTIYEVPVDIKEAIEKIAQQEGLSPSSVVVLLLADGVRRYRGNQISFWGLKCPSRSPRYEWVLDKEAVETVLRDGLRGNQEQGEEKTKYWL